MRTGVISEHGYPMIRISGVLLGLLAVSYIIRPVPGLMIMTGICLIWLMFLLYFFRDPERETGDYSAPAICSPADGRIKKITELSGDGAYRKRIYIFLSLWDVHINRIPASGTVQSVRHTPGRFYPAFQSRAWGLNERNSVNVQCEGYGIEVIQIAGLIAKRIVCRLKTGDRVVRGERYGIIKFGSCVALTVPGETDLLVSEGDRVKAGETVIGLVPNEA